ncbi:hypothetical protein BH20ACI1_BH20ACI1_19060 [soil metagenome]
MDLKRKILIVFGSLALASLTTAAITLWVTLNWGNTSVATDNHYQRSLILQRIQSQTFLAFKEVADVLTGEDDDADEEFAEAIAPVKKEFDDWEKLAETPEEVEQVRKVRQSFQTLVENANIVFQLVKQGKIKEAADVSENTLEDKQFKEFLELSEEAIKSDQEYRKVVRANNEDTRRTAQIVLGIAAFATLSLCLLLAAYLSSDLFKPLKKLTNALKGLTRGDYEQKLDDSRDDEFGKVNRAFNKLVAAVSRRSTLLESESIERKENGGESAKAENEGFDQSTSRLLLHRLVTEMRAKTKAISEKLKPAEDEDDESVQELEENLEELSQAIVRVSDFSFPLDISLTKTDIKSLLYDTILGYHNELSRRGINLELEIAEDIGEVFLDHLKIRESLNELIRNALKALPEKGGKLGLRARTDNAKLLLEIADNGRGNEDFNLDDSIWDRKKRYKTGLKLTKAIVKQHGGNLNIDSQKGEGTVIQIALPLRIE